MYRKYIKRIMDIMICLAGLIVFLPLFCIVSLLIKLEDRGPILYKADRIGKDSKIFKMYKFRSMKVNAPLLLNDDGSTFNSNNDPRVTKIGKLIRETSIDETPQILNVLRGDMSIVGPRASLSDALGTFKNDEIDKMKVKPGITGLTQAYYRNGLSNREKRLKDAWYGNNISFDIDLKIILKTIFIVIKRDGIYTNNSEKTEVKKEQEINS